MELSDVLDDLNLHKYNRLKFYYYTLYQRILLIMVQIRDFACRNQCTLSFIILLKNANKKDKVH